MDCRQLQAIHVHDVLVNGLVKLAEELVDQRNMTIVVYWGVT